MKRRDVGWAILAMLMASASSGAADAKSKRLGSGKRSSGSNKSKDSSGGSGGYSSYRNCSEARAAGAAPIRRGEPGYSRKLDRDGDGVACE